MLEVCRRNHNQVHVCVLVWFGAIKHFPCSFLISVFNSTALPVLFLYSPKTESTLQHSNSSVKVLNYYTSTKYLHIPAFHFGAKYITFLQPVSSLFVAPDGLSVG